MIVGDFNLHVDCPEVVHSSTHTSGYTLDLVIVRAGDPIISEISSYNPCISDHEAVIFNVTLNKPATKKRTIKFRSLAKINHEKFNKNLAISSLITFSR